MQQLTKYRDKVEKWMYGPDISTVKDIVWKTIEYLMHWKTYLS